MKLVRKDNVQLRGREDRCRRVLRCREAIEVIHGAGRSLSILELARSSFAVTHGWTTFAARLESDSRREVWMWCLGRDRGLR
jgi:hypothetical protein